ncbi:MAG: helix-turn-helix transcriptional regulator [Clostridia bacterium]|nr:helix-turn-helix transcriptional regulator [Clostridia bacterium]
MYENIFPVIDLAATGENIRRLRISRGLSVRQLQSFFGFEEPRAIYKWQKGESLPTVDNLYALGKILDVPMEQILITVNNKEQQASVCCSNSFYGGITLPCRWVSRLT